MSRGLEIGEQLEPLPDANSKLNHDKMYLPNKWSKSVIVEERKKSTTNELETARATPGGGEQGYRSDQVTHTS